MANLNFIVLKSEMENLNFIAFSEYWDYYRPHPKDGEGNVFSLFTPGGGQVKGQSSRRGGQGQRSIQRGGGGGSKVNPAGRGGGWVRSKVNPAGGGGGVRSSRPGGWGVRSSQRGGGVSTLRPLAGGMPLAFTQEDFLVISILLNTSFFVIF